MLRPLGGLMGDLIIFFYVLTMLNYVFKAINKRYREQIKKKEALAKVFNPTLKFIVKNHKIFGFLTVVTILLHFAIQYSYLWLSISGVVASVVMLLQVLLGVYGSRLKKRNGAWLIAHRTIAVLILVTILIHIV